MPTSNSCAAVAVSSKPRWPLAAAMTAAALLGACATVPNVVKSVLLFRYSNFFRNRLSMNFTEALPHCLNECHRINAKVFCLCLQKWFIQLTIYQWGCFNLRPYILSIEYLLNPSGVGRN